MMHEEEEEKKKENGFFVYYERSVSLRLPLSSFYLVTLCFSLTLIVLLFLASSLLLLFLHHQLHFDIEMGDRVDLEIEMFYQ